MVKALGAFGAKVPNVCDSLNTEVEMHHLETNTDFTNFARHSHLVMVRMTCPAKESGSMLIRGASMDSKSSRLHSANHIQEPTATFKSIKVHYFVFKEVLWV
jgi:hypothetical protein